MDAANERLMLAEWIPTCFIVDLVASVIAGLAAAAVFSRLNGDDAWLSTALGLDAAAGAIRAAMLGLASLSLLRTYTMAAYPFVYIIAKFGAGLLIAELISVVTHADNGKSPGRISEMSS